MNSLTPEEKFQFCFKVILSHEGGLSKDKRDPGGTTNWGISLRYLKSIGYDYNNDGKIDDEDIIGMTVDGAEEIYRKNWWDAFHYDTFNSLDVCAKVFDLAVNMGAYSAHKLLQIAINRLSETPIAVDGILGVQTFGAANSLPGCKLRNELRLCAEHRYINIIANNPDMEWARRGWMNRAAW